MDLFLQLNWVYNVKLLPMATKQPSQEEQHSKVKDFLIGDRWNVDKLQKVPPNLDILAISS